jgi:diguanylate cyclase (GGDEF)-like protein/PAS domain S-box-containing protein
MPSAPYINQSKHAYGAARSAAFSLILDAIPDPVFVKNADHRWVYVNQAFCALVGRERQWLIGKSDFDISPAAEARVFWAKDDEVLQFGGSNVNLEQHTNLDGEHRVIETKKTLIKIAGKTYLLGIIRDLTVLADIQGELSRSNQELERRIHERTVELQQSNAQLQSMAFFDPLTALPNRRLLISSLERRLGLSPDMDFTTGTGFASGTRAPVAVFYIDLDNFKRANDSHGHPFGDSMLVQLAERLRAMTQFSMVSRVGGDEFIAVAHEALRLDMITLAQVCREILERVSQPFLVNQTEASTSASVGVAISPDNGSNVVELLQSADTAMFRAKDRGRNQYAFFAPTMSVRAREHVAIERGLRRAIRSGEIDVLFQPIILASSGVTTGVEALARWHDQELGEVSPEKFVPIAESSGLIHELSHHVLRRALKLAQDVLPADQRLCVNLSALQLDRMTLVEDVRRALAESGFDPKRLELEITEGVAASKDERLTTVLNALRDLGIGLALDDFGTGYSALAHIQRLPIDRIKIDRSFIVEIAVNQKSRAMVEAMIRMAHALDLKVLAEGVETTAQHDVLCELGCDELQGYLLGRPAALASI